MDEELIELRDVYLARQVIAPFVRRTPLVRSVWLSEHTGTNVYLKLETQQETGTFKIRGAANRLLNLTAQERRTGVVTVSTGNHGRAVAYMAKQLGMRAVVCVPELVLAHKVEAMRRMGAEIVVYGQSQDAAEAHTVELVRTEGLTLISAFDDPHVIAGQGTIGLEVLEELPQVDMVIAPLSGGGLMGGIALVVKSASRRIRTIGASMARGAVMVQSLRVGRPIQLEEEKTLADSLMGGIGLNNRHTFRLAQRLLDEAVLLSEDEIAGAMVHAVRVERQIVEGGGAVGMGALLYDKITGLGNHVVVVVSGGNAEMATLTALLAR